MPGTFRHRGQRKVAVLAIGACGLAGALTLAAFAAPNRTAAAAPTYTPTDGALVIAKVPRRDPEEVAARQALAASPEDVDLAVDLARADIQRARATSDPRFLGRAQATLGRWWNDAAPPPEVLLLRATIEQSLHEFGAARADLDHLIELQPDNLQAQLTRAVVATVTADYPAARQSCAVVERLASPIIAATCIAPLDGLAGHADEAYRRLAEVIAASRRASPGLRGWALTALGELALQRGDDDDAATAFGAALALDPEDAYARAALADVLLATSRAQEASALLAGRESIDSHLVRRAIAESIAHGPDAERVVRAMRDRIAAAAERGDRVHLREQARFTLAVEGNPARALQIARENWVVQKELADARLLAETAVAARDRDAAIPVIAWARTTGVHDAQLDRWLALLGDR